MFSKNNEDFLGSLPLNMHVQTLMQVQKGKKKQKLENNKSEKKNKIKYIIYTVTYLPDNGAKNLTRSKD
jgi:cadmium resistance protein CadD (predicted permease)